MDEVKKDEMIDKDELLGDKAELLGQNSQDDNDKIDISGQDVLPEEDRDEYVNIYSGRALKPEELFRFSIREDTNVVLVAGPYASGKTTLIVMLYRLFLAGYNKELCFAGSNTMEGFRERSINLLCKSGKVEPSVARTSTAAEDRYLHLALLNAEGKKQNIFFADISGEKFSSQDDLEALAESFSDCENVIVVVDGERLCDVSKRNNVIFETELLLRKLLNKKILVNSTKLQIVFTKKDKVDNSKQKEEIVRYLQENENSIITNFKPYVHSVKCTYLSALSEEPEECEKLESILKNCMENVPVNYNLDLQTEKYELIRNFDKFQVRESI